ncbi:MAG: protein kinase [Thermoanaerobaculia bacterium]
MSSDPRLPELFADLAELDEAERERQLSAVATEEPELARELRELLAADAGASESLERPAMERLGEENAEAGATEPFPVRIGPFRLLLEIGRGGLGRVFLAEQATESFRRRVALKILDSPGLGGEALRRFRDEVRILAALEHPGIARFLDGGRSPEGTWFLALEFVEGDSLTDAARRLDLEGRLRLFVQVLDALAYAHKRQVVHRDVKPGNLLVAKDGTPKIVDFGISKLLDVESDEAQPVTRTELRAFTPQYASPEQFRGEPAHPASDIYSAGAVLYELVAGVRPHGNSATARQAIERAVLELEPDPPSTAARRSEDATTQPARLVRGRAMRDLDAVCLKALAKRPEERYSTASEFAADLRRYLAGEPVLARRSRWRGRVRRIVRRRRAALLVLAALLALAALHFGRSSGVRPGVDATVTGTPVVPKPFPFSAAGTAPLEELQQRFEQEPGNLEAGSALAISLNRENRSREAALIVARMRQIPEATTDPLVDYADGAVATALGEPQRALLLYTRALTTSQDTGRGELIGQIRATRGRLLATLGRHEEGTKEMEAARDEFTAAGDPASLARVMNDLALEAVEAGDLERGEEYLEAALSATRAASPANSGATILGNLANLALLRGHPDVAEKRYRETVAIFRKLERPGREALHREGLANALWELGRGDEALAQLDTALELARTQPEGAGLVERIFSRAATRLESGITTEAERAATEIDHVTGSTGLPFGLAFSDSLRGRLALLRGELTTGLTHLEECRRLVHEAGAESILPELDLVIAEALTDAGKLVEARALLDALADPLRERGDRIEVPLADALLVRIDLLAGASEAASERLVRLTPAAATTTSIRLRLAVRRADVAVRRAQGRSDEARELLDSAIREATAAGRRVLAAELRLERATLDLDGAKRGDAVAALHSIESEARSAGWLALARRARHEVAAGAPGGSS